MIIVSDFNNTLEIDGRIDTALFQYLLTMALNGHKVGIFSGNPDQAREYVEALASDKDAMTPILETIKERKGTPLGNPDEIRAELIVGELIHIGDKPQLRSWLKGLNARKADIGFDDDISGSPISPLCCTIFIDRHSETYDRFMADVQSRGPEHASTILKGFQTLEAPAPSFMN